MVESSLASTPNELVEALRSDLPLGTFALAYLNKCDQQFQQEVAGGMADVLNACTPAFKEQRAAPLAICTPAQSETEGSHISRTLQQYFPQRRAPRSRLLLFANHIKDPLEREVERTISGVRRFMAENPRFPLGLLEGEYEVTRPWVCCAGWWAAWRWALPPTRRKRSTGLCSTTTPICRRYTRNTSTA